MKEHERSELVKYRIAKANSTLNEIQLHIENKLWNTAINRLYYACYYAVTALLINNEINTQIHAGVRQMFGLHFIKSGILKKDLGKFYSDLFDMRQNGDYDDFVDFTKEDVLDLFAPASELISTIEKEIKK